jgi:hypothetical protein
MNNLAYALYKQSEYDEAEKMDQPGAVYSRGRRIPGYEKENPPRQKRGAAGRSPLAVAQK